MFAYKLYNYINEPFFSRQIDYKMNNYNIRFDIKDYDSIIIFSDCPLPKQLNKEDSKLISLFANDTHEFSKQENILVAQKILNSIVMDYYIKTTSVSIEGGFPCYQKNFIEKFTIPDFSKEEIEILRNLESKEEIDELLIKKYQLNIPVPKRLSYTSSSVLANPA